jgi:hypothetical protein
MHQVQRVVQEQERIRGIIKTEYDADPDQGLDLDLDWQTQAAEDDVEIAAPPCSQKRPSHCGDQKRNEQRHHAHQINPRAEADVGARGKPGQRRANHRCNRSPQSRDE